MTRLSHRSALAPALALSGGIFSLVAFTAPGCTAKGQATSTTGGQSADPGALVRASMSSRVGVLLDEIPEDRRDALVLALQARGEAFWVARARAQVNLTKYRLAFRNFYYVEGNRMQLPLPPDGQWKVTLQPDAMGSVAPRRVKIGAHDLVVVDYLFESTLLAPLDSPGKTEPELAEVGGTWDEPFIFPVDPELLFQRTGYACMDEAGFPPNSVDAEEVAVFYDQECRAQGEASKVACHWSALPAESCVEALDSHVGKVEAKVHFERLAWSREIADEARVGAVSNEAGPDMRAGANSTHFPPPKVVYRYIPEGDCTLAEACVGAPGWRRLLQFSSVDWNTGAKALDIGAVDYLLSGEGGGDLAAHHIYEYSACHQHYHFTHYGSFTFGPGLPANGKRGFCLLSNERLSNNEGSPLQNPYSDCSYQGIEAGWGDNYNAGIDCQWIDVTGYDVSHGPAKDTLRETFNPDGFLCEGTPVLDAEGQQAYAPTSFTTAKGEPVDKPVCDYLPGWADDNRRSEEVVLPNAGESFVTAPCTRGQIGPLRDCGFAKEADLEVCSPGAAVKIHCSVPAGSAPRTARFCESSSALQAGTACVHASALGGGVVTAAGVDLTFTCPAARSATEAGGLYSIYSSPLVEDDSPLPLDCQVAF